MRTAGVGQFVAGSPTVTDKMFDALTTFFGKATESHPALIILDDLHWADGPTPPGKR